VTAPQPGDVLVTRSNSVFGRGIRIVAAIRDQPNLGNHVAIVHHTDKAGTTWCIEGRPGGVGWRDARDYLASKWTVTNAGQPKTPAQRKLVCDAVHAALGTPYDWQGGIAADAATALHLPDLWTEKWDGAVPGHVVCSSLAAWAYSKGSLAHPVYDDLPRTTPADWLQFVITRAWSSP
jgi:hypothetical protein